MRTSGRLSIAAICVVGFMLGTLALVRADDADTVRQQLTSLGQTVDSLDAALEQVGEKRTELQMEMADFARRVAESDAQSQKVKELSQQYTDEKRKLAIEEQNTADLCGKKVSEREYKRLLTACEKARTVYQNHFDELQQQYQLMIDKYSKSEAVAKQLATERPMLEQKRQDIEAARTKLHEQREEAVKQFNETRERLISQSK